MGMVILLNIINTGTHHRQGWLSGAAAPYFLILVVTMADRVFV